MMKNLKQKMKASIFEVLETMFYMALEFEESGDIEKSDIEIKKNLSICRLDFSGKLSGHFIIFVPGDLLTAMTSDFMGENPAKITEEYREGTIKEVINMVGGNFFASLDNESEFRLGIPIMVEGDEIIESILKTPPERLVIAESINGSLGFIINEE